MKSDGKLVLIGRFNRKKRQRPEVFPERIIVKEKLKLISFFITLGVCLFSLSCQESDRDDPRRNQSDSVLFQDSMTTDWKEHWFLDGERAILENQEDGLHFTATPSKVDKNEDRETFDAHHAVLWTKREFEGDISIRYEITRTSPGFTSLLYIHAQGLGSPPYLEDIFEWRELRTTASMNLYFTHMNLTCLTFREQIRPRRYPWSDADGNQYEDRLIGSMIDYDQLPVGNSYVVQIEWRRASLSLRVEEIGNPDNFVERTMDLTEGLDPRRPPQSDRGRIGLRQMGGTGFVYRNFEVRKL